MRFCMSSLSVFLVLSIGIHVNNLHASYYEQLQQKYTDLKISHPVLSSYIAKAIPAVGCVGVFGALHKLAPQICPRMVPTVAGVAATAYVASPLHIYKEFPDVPLINGTLLVENKLILTQSIPDNDTQAFKKMRQALDQDPLALLQKHIALQEKYDKKVFEKFVYFDEQAIIAQEDSRRSYYADAYRRYALNYVKKGKQWITKQVQQFPLFFLDECQGVECNLSRYKNPARDAFETDVSQEIFEHSQAKKKMLTYASLGSGNLFEDFLIIDKALQKGVQTLRVVLIDTAYSGYLAIHRAHSIPPEYSHIARATNAFQIYNERFKQFMSGLRVLHPHSEVQVYLYDSLQAYADDIKNNKIPAADIYVGADLHTQGRELYEGPLYESVIHPDGVGFLLHCLTKEGTSFSCAACILPLHDLPVEMKKKIDNIPENIKRYQLLKYYSSRDLNETVYKKLA